MAKGEDITTKFKVDVSDLKKGISEANRQIKLANAEFKAASAGMDDWKKSSEGVSAKLKQLQSVLTAQNSKLKNYKDQLKAIEETERKNGQRADELKTKLQQLASQGVSKTSAEYKKYETALNAVEKEQLANKTAADNLKVTILNQQAAVNSTEREIRNYTTALDQLETESNQVDSASDDVAEGIEYIGDKADKADSKVGKLAKGLATALVAGAAAAAAGLVALTKSAIANYAEYEQLVGGVDTLFKGSSKKVQKYADNAYKTAGVSANQYMETVTSFSASLLQSLSGDTEKAADVADMALTDMADNANKMGTAMGSIQDAYQGFAKQNYTMLDNLKLGYGGTKTEMERLLADATKISGVKYDISNLNDVYQAIHVIQGELGITGTTAKEAATTIQGSAAAMKASWSNLMTGLADENANMDELIKNFIDSVGTYASNLLPRIGEVMTSIVGIVREHLPEIAEQISTWLNNLFDNLISQLPDGFKELASAIKDGVGVALDIVKELFKWIIDNGDLVISLLAGIAGGFLALKVASIIQAVTTALQGMTVAQWLLNAAMNANPIGLIALAIGALIAAITLLILNWDKVKEVAIKCWDAIKNAASATWDFIVSVWTAASTWFNNNVVTPVKNFFTEMWDKLKTGATNAWNGIKNTWTVVSGWFNNTVVKPVSNFFSDMWDKLKSGAKSAWDGIKNVFSNVTSWFKDQFTKAWTAVKNVFSTGGKIFDGIKEGITSAFKNVVNAIIRGINKVIAVPFNAINNMLDKIRNVSIAGYKPFEGLISRFNVPKIPELERGIGIAKKGHKYLLEGKGNEAVVPLDKNKYWIKAVADDMRKELQGGLPNNLAGNLANNNVNNFTQIINAPKSPSRAELYRDARNLLEYTKRRA